MSDAHKIYLNIGSNIQPEVHLPQAIDLLRKRTEILALSNAWESRPVGGSGPNFLNACMLIATSLQSDGLKEKVIRPIESSLGRMRSENKNSPRTIDIDIIMMDGEAVDPENWKHPFVVIPMAEIAPEIIHPKLKIKMSEAAAQMQNQIWIEKRPAVLSF